MDGILMLTYRDMTFCVTKDCKKPCQRYLTKEIQEQADKAGLPIAIADYNCEADED